MTTTTTTTLPQTTSVRAAVDAGVVVLTMDAPDSSVNLLSARFESDLEELLDWLENHREEVRAVVLTSAKRTFFVGGDLNLIRAVDSDSTADFADGVRRTKARLRRLETLGVPVVAALNGSALGGGLEIALACHHRVVVADPAVRLGFPEVTMGLLPGGGGIVRTVRRLGLEVVEELLLSGASLGVEQALAVGLVEERVGALDELLPRAIAWANGAPDPAQPWDRKGYQIPGPSPDAVAGLLTLAVRRKVRGAPYPAPRAIVAAAVEGARIGFDAAMEVETRYFVGLAAGRVAQNMIKANFFDVKEVRSGAARPDVPATAPVATLAVVGAGMMGAGLAYQAALKGLAVRLMDTDAARAERGKDHARTLVAKAAQRGTMTAEQGAALLDRISVVTEDEQLAGSDAVIEAVVEDSRVKSELFARIEPHLPGALLVTNTSTLPITGLAHALRRRADFVGMHFFSPVDRMPLVEIIAGREGSAETLARAFDLGLALGKTPIVVNDSRGFFTSRTITARMNEALTMIGEGVPAISVERASRQAGYPVGILQFLDEVTITLPRKVLDEARAAAEAAGQTWVPQPSEPVLVRLIDEHGRVGRSAGAGFYDFVEGRRTTLWPGLREHFEGPGPHPPMRDLVERLLFTDALETARCFDEGVLTSVVDANVGSLLGIAFPPWTGGVMQYVVSYEGGVAGFVARAGELAAAYGPRFLPPASLRRVLEV